MSSSSSVCDRSHARNPEGTASQVKSVLGHSSAVVTVENKSISKLYALTIGINTYPSLGHLEGAAGDADEMAKFLTQDLKVPSDHIVNLRNESATRSEIIKAIQGLQGDQRIERGDPILIYYAGHGGLTKASSEWEAKTGSNEIQVIFPWDYNMIGQNSKEKVQCIPDRTIHALLNDLAEAKGNNITVVFDSCYSASGSRFTTDENPIPDQIARHAKVVSEIPYSIDSDIIESRGAFNSGTSRLRYPKLPLYKDQASHVHLAACGCREQAWESEKRGMFTTALLRTMRACGADQVTYHNLMVYLPSLPKQTPHCYGTNRTRILFNALVPSRKINFIPVVRAHQSWVLQAGASSGVTLGSVWELYDMPTEESEPIATLRACLPQISSTTLEQAGGEELLSPNVAISGRLYARQIRIGEGNELKVYFSPEGRSLIPYEHSAHQPEPVESEARGYECTREVGFVIHDDPDTADLTVDLLHNNSTSGQPQTQAVYTLYNPQVQAYAASVLESRSLARLDMVRQHLSVISRWNWHLKRTNTASLPEPVLSMEFVKLGEYSGYTFKPTRGSLQNLNAMDVVEIKARTQDEYGIKLVNHSPVPLYARVFYFDVSNFSITNMFGSAVANGRADAEIPAQGYRLIGDESDGGASISFGLPEDQAIEVGFIKVFWSTEQLELDNLEQAGLDGPVPVPRPASSRKILAKKETILEDWGTLLATLVQRA